MKPTTQHMMAPENCSNVMDLGVKMSEDATFTTHIQIVVKKARVQVGWILRTFMTREREPMLALYKALVITLLEYCCQLWNPWKSREKQALEGIQCSFTSKIRLVKNEDYCIPWSGDVAKDT